MEENVTLEQDILENIRATSEAVCDQEAGSDKRLTEAKIYDMQVKTINEHYKIINEEAYNRERLDLERHKVEEELKLQREVEEIKLSIERSKARNELGVGIAKVALSGLGMAATIWTGILTLKANMKYGGMMGKDAQSWFRDINRIKL